MSYWNQKSQYGWSVQLFHLLGVILFLPQLIGGFFLESFSKPFAKTAFMWHKGIGVVLFWIVLLRLINRFMQPTQPRVRGVGRSAMLSHWTIMCLLVLIFLMPLTGWVMSSAAGRLPWLPVLGYVSFPVFKSKLIAGIFHDAHIICAYLTAAILLSHVSIVVYNYMRGVKLYQSIIAFLLPQK